MIYIDPEIQNIWIEYDPWEVCFGDKLRAEIRFDLHQKWQKSDKN